MDPWYFPGVWPLAQWSGPWLRGLALGLLGSKIIHGKEMEVD